MCPQLRPYRFVLLCILIMAVSVAVSVQSANDGTERILSFKAYYTVTEDGAVSVTEKIRVRTQGQKILHGIYRILPTVYDREEGKVSVQITITGMRKDNAEEFFTEEISDGKVKFRLGNESIYLAPGDYQYEISYIVLYPIRYNYNDNSDALYWNVTGHEWRFPMDTVEAYISLPPTTTVASNQLSAYSGRPGATACQCLFQNPSSNTASFRMTNKLLPGEEFTIAAPFTRGVVAFHENPPFVSWQMTAQMDLLMGAGIILVVYLIIGVGVGRKKIPQFTGAALPDFRISPAAVRYVQQMKYDTSVLIVAVLNMAEKGYLTIQRIASKDIMGDYELTSTGIDTQCLSEDEKVLVKYLFHQASTVKLKQPGQGWLSKGYSEHQKILRRKCDDVYFRRNGWWKFIAIAIALTVMIFCFIQTPAEGIAGGFVGILFIGAGTIGATAMLREPDKSVLYVIFLILVFSVWFGFLFFLLIFLVGPFYFVSIAAVAFCTAILLNRLSAYTKKGIELLEQIARFRNFTNQIQVNNFSEDQRATMMRLLPYAVALDLAGKFKELIPAYAYATTTDDSTGMFLISSLDTFSSSLTHAAIDSSSDGGSSDSSSSGGGDSGGGGGGW